MGWKSTAYKGSEYLWYHCKAGVTLYYIPVSGKPVLIYTGVAIGAQAALEKHSNAR